MQIALLVPLSFVKFLALLLSVLSFLAVSGRSSLQCVSDIFPNTIQIYLEI